uniref:Uncharacterized protein n=1 Tax=Esox lucius TaxID=8010 RepID=A0AAY5JZP8_ESOLU
MKSRPGEANGQKDQGAGQEALGGGRESSEGGGHMLYAEGERKNERERETLNRGGHWTLIRGLYRVCGWSRVCVCANSSKGDKAESLLKRTKPSA